MRTTDIDPLVQRVYCLRGELYPLFLSPAAFAQDLEPGEIDSRVHRMFIEGKAMSRYTVPRYSLLDHAHFDRHLIAEYGNTRIEDMWKPYFAVSADLSDYRIEVHRDGPVWEAIRASAAIPALLPPFYTGDGRMLVDITLAYNPYCAYNEDWSCPLTPFENRVKVPIRAGEKVPEGEWVANDAKTWLHPGAGSVAEASLWDRTGQIGRATQSLFVAPR